MKGNMTINGETVEVAVKTVKKDAGVLHFKALLMELKIMAFIGKHPNIVNLIGACTQNLRKRNASILFRSDYSHCFIFCHEVV
jgi:FMS-like tyrosine kinase 1